MSGPGQSSNSLLTKLGQAAMLRAAQARALPGDLEAVADHAAWALAHGHMSLVGHIANRFTGHGFDQEELAQEGALKLALALRQYEPACGCKFVTYAGTVLRRHLRRYVLERGGLVRVTAACRDPGAGALVEGNRCRFAHGRVAAPPRAATGRRWRSARSGRGSRAWPRSRSPTRWPGSTAATAPWSPCGSGSTTTRRVPSRGVGAAFGVTKERARQVARDTLRRVRDLVGDRAFEFIDNPEGRSCVQALLRSLPRHPGGAAQK